MIFLRIYQLFFYYLTLFFFGLFGLLLNLFSLIAGRFFRDERGMQRIIHGHFALLVWWMRFIRLLDVSYHGFERFVPGGQLLVANHPGLMDVTFILARVREAVCVFKPAIRRNPVLGAAARCAGYLAADGSPDVVRAVCDTVSAGHTVVLFPEGTRTPANGGTGIFKPGFVLVARRTGRPVQLLRITWDTNVLVKGRAWWKLPRLPGRVDLTLGPRVLVPVQVETAEAAERIGRWFQNGDDPELPLA